MLDARLRGRARTSVEGEGTQLDGHR